MKRSRVLFIVILVAVITAGGVYLYFFTRDRLENNNGQADYRPQAVSTEEELASESPKVEEGTNGTKTSENGNEDIEQTTDAKESDSREIEKALGRFMEADFKKYDPDAMWGLISNKRKEIEAQERGLTREYFF